MNAEPHPDLTAAPYGSDAEAIAWVKCTIDSMAEDEKVGQLFMNLNNRFDDDFVDQIVQLGPSPHRVRLKETTPAG